MKLVQISFQPGQDRDNEKFSDYYARVFGPCEGDAFSQRISMMTKLIKHLEDRVEAPPQWVCTSLQNLVFHDRDFATFEEAIESEGSVTIHIELTYSGDQYQIRRFLPQSQRPWRSVVGSTADIAIAGEMVADALAARKANNSS